jgi:oligopeptide transport system substrate-binding protein
VGVGFSRFIPEAGRIIMWGMTRELIGRERQLEELKLRLIAAVAGECQFVVIGGEAGVGKGRLLEEVETFARERAIPALHARLTDQEAFPYQAYFEIIQEHFLAALSRGEQQTADLSDLAADLTALFPLLQETEEIRTAMGGERKEGPARKFEDSTYIFEVLARTLIRIAGGKPLLILIKDLHAGGASLEALPYIVRRLGPTPTLIAATYTTTDVVKRHPLIRILDGFQGDRRFLLLRVDPFFPSEHRRFLQSILEGGVEEGLADQLYEATQGNPYFAVELVRALTDAGRIRKQASGAYALSETAGLGTLPETIQQTVQRRLERLPKAQRDLLAAASVVGHSFDLRDLELLTGKKRNQESSIESLVQSHFLQEQKGAGADRFLFPSGVVHDVVYGSLTRKKRKDLHQKYATALEERNAANPERVYQQLMHHYSRAGINDRVVEYGMMLAVRALAALSTEEAVRAANMVLQSVDTSLPENRSLEAEARTLLAAAHRMARNSDAALKELQLAIPIFEREGLLFQVVRATLMAAETSWEGRHVTQTIQWVQRGIAAARSAEETESLIKLLTIGATVANLRGDYDQAQSFLAEIDRLRTTSETEEAVEPGGMLRVALPLALRITHPVSINFIEEEEVLSNVYETLVASDPNGNLVPGICERWESVDRGNSFLFTVRGGVRFHDGLAVTASDLKNSIERAARSRPDSLPPAFAAIRGIHEFLSGETGEIAGVVVVADNQLQIRLKEPLGIYPALLTHARTGIFKERAEGAQEAPLGTGPFRVVSIRPDRVELSKNPEYRGTPPLLDGIEFRCGMTPVEIASALRSGDIDLARDLAPQDLETILRDRRFRNGLVEKPKKNVYFLIFHQNSPLGGNALLRRALCGIIRTRDLVQGTIGRFAMPASGFLPPGILGHDPGKRNQPLLPEKARELLQASGIAMPLRLKAAVHQAYLDRYAALSTGLFAAWKEIGVEVTVETPDMPSYVGKMKDPTGLDLMLVRWSADYDDPDNFTFGLFHTAYGHFRKYYSSSEMDRMMENARAESDPEARSIIYRNIENRMMESGIILPLFHEIDYRVAAPQVKRLALKSRPPYVDYLHAGKSEAAAPVETAERHSCTVRVPMAGALFDLDPSTASQAAQAEVLPIVFETLTKEGEGARVLPWLASEFHAEEGGRVFRFRLREDVRFHDGRRLTARDVRYSLEHLLQNRNSDVRWLLSMIEGADDILAGKALDLTGFRILSTHEFVIRLVQPISFFPAVLTYTPAAIVPEGTESFGGNWQDGCVGTGPFRMTRFEPGKRLELEAHPNYWRPGLPKSDNLVFFFGLKTDEILSNFREGRFSVAWELQAADIGRLRREAAESGYRYFEAPLLSTYFLICNTGLAPLNDESVRRTLLRSIDVRELVRTSAGSLALPAGGLIPPGLQGYDPARKPPVCDPAASGNGMKLTLSMNPAYKTSYATFADALSQSLRRSGFDITVVDLAADRYAKEMREAHVNLALERWIADFPDADSFLHGLLHSREGALAKYSANPDLDRLAEKGRMEVDPAVRHQIYRDAEDLIASRCILLPLFHQQAYGFGRPELQNFSISVSSPMVNYENLWLRT